MNKRDKILRRYRLKTIEELTAKYKLFQIKLASKEKYSEKQIANFQSFIAKFDRCVDELIGFKRTIFINTFINKEFYWWEGKYSDAQYYRLRRDASIEFLQSFRKKGE